MTRKKLLRSAVALLSASLLAACASASGYHARTEPVGNGYSEERIDGVRWRVEFSGGEGDSREEVDSFLLYRAAELTVNSGYDWFMPSGREIQSEGEIIVQAPTPSGIVSPVWRPQWRSRRLSRWTDWMPAGGGVRAEPQEPPSAQVRHVERFAAREEITMGRGPGPNGAFDARRVLSELGPTVAP